MTGSPISGHPFSLRGVHHAAYRCKDAKQIVEWYSRILGMEYTSAFSEDHVPSTGEYDPYMHVFLDAGNGNILAFFELPNQPEMGSDPNTPAWVKHLAFRVASEEALLAAKDHVEGLGIDVLGPTHHGIFKSIYFFDPNGHRLELAADIGTDDQYAELKRVARPMLEEWSRTKTAPQHASWLHDIARARHPNENGNQLMRAASARRVAAWKVAGASFVLPRTTAYRLPVRPSTFALSALSFTHVQKTR